MNYEIREMSLGEILDTGFRLVRNHFKLFVSIALTFTIPTELLMQAIPISGDPTLALAFQIVGLGLFLLLVSPITTAAITHAVSEVYSSRETGYRDSLVFGLKMFMPLVGTALLMTLLVMVGFLLLVVPGIYLAIAYMLLYQVMVVEQRGGWNALERSRNLSSGHLLRIAGIYTVGMIVMVVVSSGLGIVTAGIPYLSNAVNAIVQAVFISFLSATMVVVYFDIRCRKEAFDLEHLASLVAADTPNAQPGAA